MFLYRIIETEDNHNLSVAEDVIAQNEAVSEAESEESEVQEDTGPKRLSIQVFAIFIAILKCPPLPQKENKIKELLICERREQIDSKFNKRKNPPTHLNIVNILSLPDQTKSF